MQEIRLSKMLLELDGIPLTESEENTVVWLSQWGKDTADNFISIIRKCRERK